MQTSYYQDSKCNAGFCAFALQLFRIIALAGLIFQPGYVAANERLDNGESGTSFTGTWNVSGGANPYGTESLYANSNGASYTFDIALAAPGEYQVFAWWTEWSNRRTSVPYDITGLGGTGTVTVNQRANGGQWNQLGSTWNFGSSARITIRSLGSGTTSADAIMLVPTGANLPPVLVTIGDQSVTAGNTLSFTVSATDSDGTTPLLSATGLPPGASFSDNSNGTGSFSWPTSTSDAGTSHNITFIAADASDASLTSRETITISAIDASGPLMLDNGESGTSFTGTWNVSGGANPYGTESLYANSNGASYTFDIALAAPGEYQVFAWWTEWSNRRTSVPYDITGLGGTGTVTVNQRANGGQWNQLGSTWNFGSSARITIRSLGSGTTSADAIMLVPTGANLPPVLVTIGDQSVTAGNTLSFTVSATDSDGTTPLLSATGLPPGASFSDNSNGTGSFSWPTSTSDAGTSHNITFIAADASDASLTSRETITISAIDASGPLMLDNGESGTSFTGTWNVSGGANPYGTESLYANSNGASYTFDIALAAPGEYQVFAWWTEWSNRRTSVPYDITGLGGTGTVTVNQRANGGQWNQLGSTWNFGSSARITIRSLGSGTTSADAIMLVPASSSCAATPRDQVFRGILPAIGNTGNSALLSFSIPLNQNGTLGTATVVNSTTGEFEYSPSGAQWGEDSFAYQVDGVPGGPVTGVFNIIIEPRVMPLGDSITQGSNFNGTDFGSSEFRVGYRMPLFESLTMDGYPLDLVGSLNHGWGFTSFDSDHEGHGGWTASELAWGRNGGYPIDGVRAWLDTNPADVILLHAGTNGLFPDGDMEVEAILNEIDIWENSPNGNPVTVVLARIIDQNPLNPDVTAFNNNLVSMADDRILNPLNLAYPDDIVLVDQQSALNYPGDLSDRLHPDSTGYRKMASRWENTLRFILPKCP